MSFEDQHQRNRTRNILLLIGILLISSNLRAPLTAVGSLVPYIRESLGISNTVIGSITTLPLLAFALISPFAPKVARRLGMERTIFLSMILLAVGLMLRSVTGIGTLFVGTALIGVAISFGNVLLPGLIKVSFPVKIGLIMGLYAVSMNIFGALSSGLSVPLSKIDFLGWQGTLAIWTVLAIIALIVWFPQIKKPSQVLAYSDSTHKKKTNMWKSFTAWQVTIFMGLQSLMFYTTLTWLPEILQLSGYTDSQAGWMLSLMQFALIPVTFIVPIIAGRMKDQKILSAFTGLSFILGISGLISGQSSVVVVSIILLGVASGSAFSLAMMFFALRTRDGYEAAELSGMAQSFGYLLAATGPILFGALYDVFESWTQPLFMLLLVGVVIFIMGLLAGRNVVINEN